MISSFFIVLMWCFYSFSINIIIIIVLRNAIKSRTNSCKGPASADIWKLENCQADTFSSMLTIQNGHTKYPGLEIKTWEGELSS